MKTFTSATESIISEELSYLQTAQINNAIWSYLFTVACDYIDFFHGVSYRLFSTGPVQNSENVIHKS